MKEVNIPEGVTYIGERAFGGCTSVDSLTIPASVEKTGSDPFSAWTDAQTIYVIGKSSEDMGMAEWRHWWLSCSAKVVYDGSAAQKRQ